MPDLVPPGRPWPERATAHRSIVIVDLVESVRLMREHEASVIDRWRQFVADVRARLLPAGGGRLVKSLGDGLLMEFENTVDAVRTALELHRRIAEGNQGCTPDQWMQLRAGVHESDIVVDEVDVYGAGVNLASRLAGLAGAGETVVSPQARAALVDGLDVDIEDLGEVYLKHFDAPQRAYRVGPAQRRPSNWSFAAAGASDRVGIAVIPFGAIGTGPDDDALGEIVADDLIMQLSRLRQLHVVSRLSTTAFRHRASSLEEMVGALKVQYIVHGSCRSSAGRLYVRAELVDAVASDVLWADGFESPVATLLDGQSRLSQQLLEPICHAMVGAEVRRAATQPLPTLHSYTILLGAIAMMHRLSPRDFERSREMLEYLIERHPGTTAPRAWLGKWHVLRVAQGWSPDPAGDAAQARSVVARALDLDPGHSLALAIDGQICAYIRKDLATAAQRYQAAIDANPSEGLAWLFQSALHSYAAEGPQAVDCAMRAQSLSPLDPMRYYYDNFTSTAKLSAEDYAGAIEYGKRSLRANRTHGPTLRILAIAQQLAGQHDDARATIAEMLKVEPRFSVSRFLDRYPGAAAPHAARYADALRAAGLPA